MTAMDDRRLCPQPLRPAVCALLLSLASFPAAAQMMGSVESPTTTDGKKTVELALGDADKAKSPEDTAWEETQNQRLARGDALLKEKQPEAAMREAFDPIIQAYQARYASDDTLYYCARTTPETLIYMLGVAADNDRGEGKGKGKNAVTLGPTWAYAYFGKAYALIDLNRFDEAATEIDRALELSPHNPQFLSERGYLYRASRQWDKMLESYRSAFSTAEYASPDSLKESDQARALRGEGFALIELGDLKEAERSFKQSLKLEPKNELALSELDYIKQLRKQKQ